jgi:small subunit ribosomal protein S17
MADETTNEPIDEPVEGPGDQAPDVAQSPAAEAELAADEATTAAVEEEDAVAAEAEPAADEATTAVEEEDVVAAETEPAPDQAPAVEATPAAAPAPTQERARKKKRLPRALRPLRSRPKRERPATRKPIVRLPKPESERGRRQERRGVVVSSAMDKTIIVKVDTIKAHPRYKKVVRRSTKFHAHDERNEANVGDVVRIVETRPISKTKHWRLAEILEAAK